MEILLLILLLVGACIFLFGGNKAAASSRSKLWKAIPDQYQSLAEVNSALRKAGLESSNLIIGIDYTKSNTWTGERTFGNKCLHHLDPTCQQLWEESDDDDEEEEKGEESVCGTAVAGSIGDEGELVVPGAPPAAAAPGGPGFHQHDSKSKTTKKKKKKKMEQLLRKGLNPYQSVVSLMGKTLEKFDDDHKIPAYGFGDEKTQDRAVFALSDRKGEACLGMKEVLLRYTKVTPRVKLSGPTSFKPIIDKAVQICRSTGQYHILIIIADGQVTNKKETVKAIVRASSYPLSIIMVGVGDGPWDEMERFDDELPERKFDNFQFVDFHKTTWRAENPEVSFAVNALQEVPDQYQAIQKLGLL